MSLLLWSTCVLRIWRKGTTLSPKTFYERLFGNMGFLDGI